MNQKSYSIGCIVLFASFSFPVQAYIGPGMAGGVFTAIVGFLAALFLMILGVIYYPIKRRLMSKKETIEDRSNDDFE